MSCVWEGNHPVFVLGHSASPWRPWNWSQWPLKCQTKGRLDAQYLHYTSMDGENLPEPDWEHAAQQTVQPILAQVPLRKEDLAQVIRYTLRSSICSLLLLRGSSAPLTCSPWLAQLPRGSGVLSISRTCSMTSCQEGLCCEKSCIWDG